MPPARAPSRSGTLRSLFHDEQGTAAVEWAMVGPVFILIMLASVEIGLTLATQAVVEGAARSAARWVGSGAIAGVGGPTAQVAAFRAALCRELSVLPGSAGCGDNVVFEVQPLSRSTPGPFAGGGGSCAGTASSPGAPGACTFDLGAPGQIMRVAVQYRRPFILPWVGACLSGGGCWTGLGSADTSGGGAFDVLHRAVAVIRHA